MKYFFYSILLLSLCSCSYCELFKKPKSEDERAIEIHDEKLDDKMRGRDMLNKRDPFKKKENPIF